MPKNRIAYVASLESDLVSGHRRAKDGGEVVHDVMTSYHDTRQEAIAAAFLDLHSGAGSPLGIWMEPGVNGVTGERVKLYDSDQLVNMYHRFTNRGGTVTA